MDILWVDLAVKSLANGECDFLFAFDILFLFQPPYQNIFLGSVAIFSFTLLGDGVPLSIASAMIYYFSVVASH
ncbi:hypothetical protein [Moritella yayanosii]|uniref:Uncharacterized protein n=1 Tax=Moritella yayanosii TaxID=69539 RepID=A0A330LKY3_9GAMM|nr:hypothetical protein [Moritella yayanosii]SQD77684.1 protein of unknown function [Moritella yayanosii]